MKINVPKENYIFIELNNEDMKNLNITYESLDYSNVETRRAIWTVLDEAKHSLGRDFDLSENFRVEVLPCGDGGCLLLFTICEKLKKFKLLKGKTELIRKFNSLDDILDMSRHIKREETENLHSSLFLYDNRHIMIFSGKISHSLMMKINEFSDEACCGKRELSQITEYGYCLIRDNALERLSGCVS